MSNQPRAKSQLANYKFFLLLSFPFILYFSYYPVIPLFSSISTNYELSLPLIWLAIFTLLSLPDAIRALRPFIRTSSGMNWKNLLPLLFPFYLFLSCLWSPNPLRGFLTSSIFLCLIISAYEIYHLGHPILTRSYPCLLKRLPLINKNSSLSATVSGATLLRRLFLGPAILISLFCWLQCILDVAGLSRSLTFLCPGCSSRIFGFPHPSGFAIEPQFMGNLLLAPTLYAFYEFFRHRLRFPIPLFLLTTLFAVFSRGALYSFFLGLTLLSVLLFIKKLLQPSRLLSTLTLVASALILCFLAQATFSHLSSYQRPTACVLSTSLAQLTLNIINFDCQPNLSPALAEPSSSPAPVFTGYVEESTNVRLNLSSLAVASAIKSPSRLLFGTGLGSAGTTLYRDGMTASPKEIIQNQYLSLLLETGLLGLTLLALALYSLYKSLKKPSPVLSPLVLSTSLAYAASLLFFSGLPNALHIYLFPAYLILLLFPEHKPIVNQEINHHCHHRHQHKIPRTAHELKRKRQMNKLTYIKRQSI